MVEMVRFVMTFARVKYETTCCVCLRVVVVGSPAHVWRREDLRRVYSHKYGCGPYRPSEGDLHCAGCLAPAVQRPRTWDVRRRRMVSGAWVCPVRCGKETA